MKLRTLITSLITLSSLALLSSCSNTPYEEPTTDEATTQWHSCTLNFDGDMPTFDGGSRAEAGTWAANSQVYIHFKLAGGETTYGNAVLGSDGKWKLNYNGRLSSGATYDCQVFYLDGNVTKDALLTSFTFDSSVGVYADTEAKDTVTDNEVSLSARLTPKTSRIRFVNNSSGSNRFYISGIEYITGLDLKTLQMTKSTNTISTYYGSAYNNGYHYGTFPDNSELQLKIGSYYYIYEMPENSTDFMAVGKSGYMNIPTTTSHNNWTVETQSTKIATYTSPKAGAGSYKLDFSLSVNQKLQILLTNIEYYNSVIYIRLYHKSGELIETLQKVGNSTYTEDYQLDLGAGSYYLEVSTSNRECTFTFNTTRN